MRKRSKMFLQLTAAGAAVTIAAGAMPVFAASISEAQKEKEALESSLDDAQALISDLEDSKAGIEDKVAQLDAELTSISEEIVSLNSRLKETNQNIKTTQKKLEKAEATEQKQFEDIKIRIKYTYENYGSMSVLTALLSSDSFSEFLNYAEYMNLIMDYDRNQLEEYAKTKQLIADSKARLEQDKEELKTMEAQLEEEKEASDLLLKEKQKQLEEVDADLSDAQSQAEEYEAEIAAQNEIIAQIRAAEAQRKKEQEEAAKKQQAQSSSGGSSESSGSSGSSSGNISSSDSYTGGVFLWPCPASQRVTSDFGYRDSPTAGASSYHQGLDIGAPYGSAIVAAADGVVFTAAYQPNGAGNYLVVSHGGGLYTVYMHCSSLAVSSGQSVKRGQTIAYVGSTGISTGNHLHFGVQLNGSYVNPWSYLR
ncbi:MAG TPA: peptidoglycan DD-metalloendopeptidase family protein [Candidatus Eubacterium avistercoris]|uniref:Peptidoglycan DD-metalloendopeptidase family protein n=1 Tax=Candidatus Eubacterium avistercoris TaxID=2838567 RepID=A0A9D2D0X2_9FIRM|nr:peptidoglycan DD-metalloendopeptidase family protein [Candidatus Eubacterium avistercoris]